MKSQELETLSRQGRSGEAMEHGSDLCGNEEGGKGNPGEGNSEQSCRDLVLLKDPILARSKSPSGTVIMGVLATFHVGRDLNAKSKPGS